MKRMDARGITLVELMVVVTISGILMGIAGFSAKGFRERYDVESQVRQLHSDLLHARVRALQGNMAYFLTMTAGGYQLIEDTNKSGGAAPDQGDMPLWPAPKQFKYCSQWVGTIIMDENGIVSKSTGPLLTNTAFSVRFYTDGIDPEYDCLSVGPTRILAGKWSGKKCETKQL